MGAAIKIAKKIPFVRKISKKVTGFIKKINKKAYGIPGEIWKQLRKNKPVMAAAGPVGMAGAEGIQMGEEFENVVKGKDGHVIGMGGMDGMDGMDGASSMPHSMSSQHKQIPYHVSNISNMTRYGPMWGGKVYPIGTPNPYAHSTGQIARKHTTLVRNVGVTGPSKKARQGKGFFF